MTHTARRTLALGVPLALFAALLTAVPAAAFGHGTGPHPSPDFSTLFAHYDDGAEEWYLSTITGEDVGYVGGIGTSGAGQGYSWEIPLEADLDGDLVLDPDGTVDLHAFIGRTGTGGVGRVTVETTFTVGDTIVASGAGETIVYAHEYQEIHWSVAPEVDRIPADGGPVVWTITVSDGVRNGIFLRLNDPDGVGASRVELPILALEGAAPEPIFEDLAGDSVNLTVGFDEATDAVHQYNWTAAGDAYDLQYAATVENGTVGVLVAAHGLIVLNETYDTDVSGSIEGAEVAGDIAIRFVFTAFQGEVSVQILPPPPEPEPVDEEPTGNETAAPASGNETDEEDGGFLPGVGPVAAALGVLAAAVVARRRRA